MPRKPRIHFPGAVYHVMLRGNDGGSVFFSEQDRLRFYIFLQYAVEKFGCKVHGFCLMDNHIHLILEVDNVPLSRIMQSLSLRHTKWINFSRSRTGHLFQGRYKAILIDADSYLLQLVSYIHLNPVRAGMTTLPELHRWSGHRAYLGIETIPWLTTEWVLAQFSKKLVQARQAYERFVLQNLAGEKEPKFHRGTVEGTILGEDHFADRVLSSANNHLLSSYSVTEVLVAVCLEYDIDVEQIRAPGKQRPFNEARALAAWIVLDSPHLTLTDLGKELNRTIDPLGRAARRLSQKAKDMTVLQLRKERTLRSLKKAESQT